MLSLRAEIRARGELRVRIEAASHQEWAKLMSRLEGASPDIARERINEWKPQFEGTVQYENQQLTNVAMPAYRQMLALFREKLWLAEPQTRAYLNSFVEFVDVWERHLQKSIPVEVITAIGHSEANLHPFYQHIEGMVDRLQKELSDVRRWPRLG